MDQKLFLTLLFGAMLGFLFLSDSFAQPVPGAPSCTPPEGKDSIASFYVDVEFHTKSSYCARYTDFGCVSRVEFDINVPGSTQSNAVKEAYRKELAGYLDAVERRHSVEHTEMLSLYLRTEGGSYSPAAERASIEQLVQELDARTEELHQEKDVGVVLLSGRLLHLLTREDLRKITNIGAPDDCAEIVLSMPWRFPGEQSSNYGRYWQWDEGTFGLSVGGRCEIQGQNECQLAVGTANEWLFRGSEGSFDAIEADMKRVMRNYRDFQNDPLGIGSRFDSTLAVFKPQGVPLPLLPEDEGIDVWDVSANTLPNQEALGARWVGLLYALNPELEAELVSGTRILDPDKIDELSKSSVRIEIPSIYRNSLTFKQAKSAHKSMLSFGKRFSNEESYEVALLKMYELITGIQFNNYATPTNVKKFLRSYQYYRESPTNVAHGFWTKPIYTKLEAEGVFPTNLPGKTNGLRAHTYYYPGYVSIVSIESTGTITLVEAIEREWVTTTLPFSQFVEKLKREISEKQIRAVQQSVNNQIEKISDFEEYYLSRAGENAIAPYVKSHLVNSFLFVEADYDAHPLDAFDTFEPELAAFQFKGNSENVALARAQLVAGEPIYQMLRENSLDSAHIVGDPFAFVPTPGSIPIPEEPPSVDQQPSLLALGPVEKEILMKERNQEEEVVSWTIYNAGKTEAVILAANLVGCPQSVTCSASLEIKGPYDQLAGASLAGLAVEKTLPVEGEAILALEGLVLSPGKVAQVRVSAAPMASGVVSGRLGLDVSYTDSQGWLDKSVSPPVLEFTLMQTESQLFNLLLESGSQERCIGINGESGATGPQAVPKVLLSWDWDDIDAFLCNAGTGREPVFCDATQFSVALLNKLEDARIKQDEGDPEALSQVRAFEAYLLQDGFSEDFQKDFTHHFRNAFFQTSSFFTSPLTPWDEVFGDPERFVFSQRDFLDAGRYKVSVDVDWSSSSQRFFEQGESAAKITVSFEKQGGAMDVRDSVFYSLPFNGHVGKSRTDEDGQIGRKGYGIGFSESNQAPVILNAARRDSGDTGEIAGTVEYSVVHPSFEDMTSQSPGLVGSLSKTNRSISFTPFNLVPVVMGITAQNHEAEGFYQLQRNSQTVSSESSLAKWVPVAASGALHFPGSQAPVCLDFSGTPAPASLEDHAAAAVAFSCPSEEEASDSFGLRWDPAEEDARLYLASLFFVPSLDEIVLKNACGNGEAVFSIPGGISRDTSESIALTGTSVSSIQNLFERVGKGEVCVNDSGQEAVFFWNVDRFSDTVRPALETLAELESFNPNELACTSGET